MAILQKAINAAIAALCLPTMVLSASSQAISQPRDAKHLSAQRLNTAAHRGLAWSGQRPGCFIVNTQAGCLYVLTYPSLVKLDSKSLQIAARKDVAEIPGRGFLSLALSPDGTRLAVYRMPDQVVLLDANSLEEVQTVTLNVSDYKTRLLWPADSKTILCLGDRGSIALVRPESRNVVPRTFRLEGSKPANWTYVPKEQLLYVTYRDANFLSRFDCGSLSLKEPIRFPAFSGKEIPLGGSSFHVNLNAVAVDARRGRIYSQSVGGIGAGRRRDHIVVVDMADSRLIRDWETGAGSSRFEPIMENAFLLFRHMESNSNAWELAVVEMEAPTFKYRINVDCDDFAVSEATGELFSLKCAGNDLRVDVFRLPLPQSSKNGDTSHIRQ